MLIQMRTHRLDLAGVVERHLDRRVRAALQSSATSVRAVSLSLADINGPRGGADLRCTVTLELTPHGSVRAEATSSDLVEAVGRALARARRSLRRSAGRGRRARSKARASAPGSGNLVSAGTE
jgi:ribosome-associated translation inhibitor RaiA